MPFLHFDAEGRGLMADISGMKPTRRFAVASATIDPGWPI